MYFHTVEINEILAIVTDYFICFTWMGMMWTKEFPNRQDYTVQSLVYCLGLAWHFTDGLFLE